VFEVWAQGIGSQNAVCGGGRYDGLAEQLGARHTPGIGFGSGMERLVLAMKEQGITVPGAPAPEVAMVYLGGKAKLRAAELMTELRSQGIATVIGYGGRSMKAQLRNANRVKAHYALVLGEQELDNGQIMLQDMQQGDRDLLPLDTIVETLLQRIQTPNS